MTEEVETPETTDETEELGPPADDEKASDTKGGGERDDGALRRANLRLKKEREDDRQKIAKLEEEFAKYRSQYEEEQHNASLKKATDAKQIDEAWRNKHSKDAQKHTQELAAKENQIRALQDMILSQERDKLIAQHAAELALPDTLDVVKLILKNRINVTLDNNNKPVPIVYDDDGKESRDTIKDLTKEIRKDKRYAKILKGAEVGSGTAQPQQPARPPVSGAQQQPSLGVSRGSNPFQDFLKASPENIGKYLGKG